MKNFSKKLFIVIIIIIFTVAFSSSYTTLNIDNLAFVVAMGIDSSDSKKIKVTFQFVNPPSSQEATNQDSKLIFDTVEASSIVNAVNIMDSYLARKLDLSHCRTIVFSEEIAKSGLSDHIYSLMNDPRVRPTSNIIVSKGTAKHYIEQSVPTLETLVTKYYDIFPNSNKYTGYIVNATIGEFFNSLVCNYCQAYTILGGLTSSDNNNKNVNDSDIKSGNSPISGTRNSENIGTAVFKDDKLVGELNAIETLCLSIINNSVKSFLISIPDPNNTDKKLDIYLYPQKDVKIDGNIVNGTPYIKIDAKFNAKIYSINKNSEYLNSSTISAISNSCNNYLNSVLSDYLYKTSTDFKSDINGLGQYILPKFITNTDFENYDWEKNYINSTFNVNISTNISSGFLLTET